MSKVILKRTDQNGQVWICLNPSALKVNQLWVKAYHWDKRPADNTQTEEKK